MEDLKHTFFWIVYGLKCCMCYPLLSMLQLKALKILCRYNISVTLFPSSVSRDKPIFYNPTSVHSLFLCYTELLGMLLF